MAGSTGRSLMTVSASPPWIRRARTTTPARFKARSGVSKKIRLPRLRLDRVESDALDRRALALSGHRQLQFDAGRPFDELEDFDHFLRRRGAGGGAWSLAA